MTILEDLKAIGVEVVPQGNNLLIRPASKVPPALKERLRAHKAEVLAALKGLPATSSPTCCEIESVIEKLRPNREETSHALREGPLAPCGSSQCAGCYEVEKGKRIHPPKPSSTWLEWLRRWTPKEGARAQ